MLEASGSSAFMEHYILFIQPAGAKRLSEVRLILVRN
jgi:hypothetical protein